MKNSEQTVTVPPSVRINPQNIHMQVFCASFCLITEDKFEKWADNFTIHFDILSSFMRRCANNKTPIKYNAKMYGITCENTSLTN